MKLKVETWGFCDFRRIGAAARPRVTMGRELRIGQWMNAQDFSVHGPFESKAEAEAFNASYDPGTCEPDGRHHHRHEEGEGFVYVGQITKILHGRNGKVSLVEIDTDA